MPKEKSSNSSSSNNGQLKTWVLIVQNNVLKKEDGTDSTPDMVKLRHPRTGVGAMFLFSPDNSIVQEIISFSEKRSWFINNSVRENGSIYFSTAVDPLFLILPYLKRSNEEGKVVPLQDLLIDNLFPETYRLHNSSVLENINIIADQKGPESLNAWRYNEEKTIQWLCKKVQKVSEKLKEKNIDVKGKAISKNFVKTDKEIEEDYCDNKHYLKYAHELVSEYLTDDLSDKLLSALGIVVNTPEKSAHFKRKLSQDLEVEKVKKLKTEETVKDGAVKKSSNQETRKSLTAKEKAKIKAASGTKSITAFFKKK